ncbi:hypothetical protein F2P81_017656 [Scophthalmus maximus]|uniref:Uncharacterized protein n=1 Tax=Scophthalmus maximus TaxID=52904 RepID=A0A6A4SEG6_SCOMX|nr:hypothetical protein F2P81_017656 [Scophthalmus maximus]
MSGETEFFENCENPDVKLTRYADDSQLYLRCLVFMPFTTFTRESGDRSKRTVQSICPSEASVGPEQLCSDYRVNVELLWFGH